MNNDEYNWYTLTFVFTLVILMSMVRELCYDFCMVIICMIKRRIQIY